MPPSDIATDPAIATDPPPTNRSGLTAMSLAALGVVFGDIGTSPLYTLKTVLDTTGPHPSAQAALGSLSLIVWTLIIVTSVKYVALAMRVDNDGEGGILALMSLTRASWRGRNRLSKRKPAWRRGGFVRR